MLLLGEMGSGQEGITHAHRRDLFQGYEVLYIEPAGRVHPGTMTVHPHLFRAPGLPIIDGQGFTGIRLPSHVIAH